MRKTDNFVGKGLEEIGRKELFVVGWDCSWDRIGEKHRTIKQTTLYVRVRGIWKDGIARCEMRFGDIHRTI